VSTKQKNEVVLREATIPDPELLSEYQSCTISFQPQPRPKAEWKKPLWLSGFPGSGNGKAGGGIGSGDIISPLINGITGLSGGVKNYHAKKKNILSRCISKREETVACTQSHPLVGVGPEKRTDKFQQNVLFVIRNFKQAYAGHFNDKQILYHDSKVGQAEEEEWRKSRDSHITNAFSEWKETILEWKNMDYYHIGLYVPYEELLDPQMGPALTSKVAQQLNLAGFPVADSQDDLNCIWWETVKDEWSRLKNYYSNYVPGYTEKQQQFMLRELKNFRNELLASAGDNDDSTKELVRILNNYYNDIRDNTRIDQPARG